MKEKAEIKHLSDRLDLLHHRAEALALQSKTSAIELALTENLAEQEKLLADIEILRNKQAQQFSAKAQKLKKMPFSREITKKEQTDMGALKKKAKGIEIVHPMTALGREMGLKAVTGFARSKF